MDELTSSAATSRRSRAGTVRLAAVFALLLVNCGEAEPRSVPGPASAAKASTAQQELLGDHASPPALVATWQGMSAEQRATEFTAQLENTTSEPLTAVLTLRGTGPHGETVSRPMGNRQIAAKTKLPIRYHLGDLPVQSVGLPGTVALVVTYVATTPDTAKKSITFGAQRLTFTPTLHVTLDADEQSATFRDAATQARLNAEQASPRSALTRLRIYDPARAEMVDVTSEVESAAPGSKPIIGASGKRRRPAAPPPDVNEPNGILEPGATP